MASLISAVIQALRKKAYKDKADIKQKYPYRVYLDHRKSLFQLAIDNGRSFEKTIILLSSGAIALSITFMKDIVGEGTPEGRDLIIVSWFLLVSTLTGVLCSIYLSMEATYKAIDLWDEAYVRERSVRSNWRSSLTKVLNLVSLIMLCAGLLLLCLFSYLNLGGSHATPRP